MSFVSENASTIWLKKDDEIADKFEKAFERAIKKKSNEFAFGSANPLKEFMKMEKNKIKGGTDSIA